MTQLLFQYSYLQILDFLTTIAFLMHGVREGNPVVRWAINLFPSPIAGLVAVKLIAVALGIYCWHRGRDRLLVRVNVLFAGLVAWNLLALIVRMAFPQLA